MEESHDELSMGLMEVVFGILFFPVDTIRYLARNPRPLHALGIVLAISIFMSIVGIADIKDNLGFLGLDASLSSRIFAVIGPSLALWIVITGVVAWFVKASVLHLTAQIYGGNGKGIPLLTVLGFSSIPQVLGAPVAVMGRYGGQTLSTLLGLAILVWVATLDIIGIREINGFSTGRAVLTFVSPLIVLVVTAVVFISTVVAMMSGVTGQSGLPFHMIP